MSQFVNEPNEGGPQILECHSPIMNLLEQYPIIGRLEQEMFEEVLGTPVRREETRTSGLYEARFYFADSDPAAARQTGVAREGNFAFALREFRLIDGPCPGQFPAAVIENLQPLIDGGRYPIKRVVGEDLVVEADVFKDGHDVVAAALKWRRRRRAALARDGHDAAR